MEQPNIQEPDESKEVISEKAEEAIKGVYDLFNEYLEGGTKNTSYDAALVAVANRALGACEQRMSLNGRIARSKIFSFMLQAYFRLVEDRINRTAWYEFKRKDKLEGNIHAIDVLVGDPVIPHDVWRNRETRKNPLHLKELRRPWFFQNFFDFRGPGQAETALHDSEKVQMEASAPVSMPQAINDEYTSMPDRMRINGESLQQLLEKVLEISIHATSSPIVLLKPYKLLVQYETGIRGLHTQLRKKYGPIAINKEFKNSHPDRHSNESKEEEKEKPSLGEEEQKLLEKYGTEEAYKELCCLIEFMDNDLQPVQMVDSGTVQKVAFSDLWHIFKPGDVVITNQEPPNAYRVLYATAGRPYLSPPRNEGDDGDSDRSYKVPAIYSDFLVVCYQIHFDGHKFGPVAESFTIQHYTGRRSFNALPIYPLRFVQDSKIKDNLESNGRKFKRLSNGIHLQYRGPNLHEGEEIDSQVVVDFKTAIWDERGKDTSWDYKVSFGINAPNSANKAEVTMVSAGGCKQVDCCENDRVFNDIDLDHHRMERFVTGKPLLTTDVRYLDDNPDKVPDEDLILFPNKVFAFVLKDRKWAVIDVNYIDFEAGNDRPKDNGWNSLVLPSGHKTMVYSLVQAHFRHRREETTERISQTDLIQGKGKGLIILLHGAPGVGKTSTAECVAELCDLPLYPITCGDLGITAGEVESRLKHIFIQAQKWKCADVFLSQRENNVKHNSLVSVFLRVLEYYQGILFLTTNRVGKIDEAFRSRVHVSLYYPPLNRRSTIKIFTENLKRVEKRGKDVIQVRRDDIQKFAKDHYRNSNPQQRWNGRQIRNAFHIAVAIAEDRALEKNKEEAQNGEQRKHIPVLRASYFKLVETASTKFDDYLHEVHGMGQRDVAKQNSNRNDDWRADTEGGSRQYQKKRADRRRSPSPVDDSESSFTGSSDVENYRQISTEDESSERSDEEQEELLSSDEELTQREKKRRADGKRHSSNRTTEPTKESGKGSRKVKERRR
ncbi:hypothetical protein BDV19DRAFT_398964 [Aspergillus venezuelensis]